MFLDKKALKIPLLITLLMVEITPEIRAQLEEQKKQCIFCRISSKEIPSEMVLDAEGIVGVMDINPCSKAHVLLYTKEHYPIMPYIPSQEFFNLFGSIPQMSKNIMKASVSESITIFIANGAVAGQQSPHFLFHMISREPNDRVGSFKIDSNDVDDNILVQLKQVLSNNIPVMLQNHNRRNPLMTPKNAVKKTVPDSLYEDEWCTIIMPKEHCTIGHLVVKPKGYDSITDIPVEVSSHIFFVCSFVATALFESLGAQGTNIIMHSGNNPDNPEGKCEFHIIARFQDDNLGLLPKSLSSKPNIKAMADKIRSDRIYIPHQLKEAWKRIEQDTPKSIDSIDDNARKEIEKAIESLKRKQY